MELPPEFKVLLEVAHTCRLRILHARRERSKAKGSLNPIRVLQARRKYNRVIDEVALDLYEILHNTEEAYKNE